MQKLDILALGGDGIGPEVLEAGLAVAETVAGRNDLQLNVQHDLLHGAAWDQHGTFLHDETLARAKSADAVLVGAVGGPQWDDIRVDGGPEMQDGLMRLRHALDSFAGLRPARFWAPLAERTPFRPGVAEDADIMVLREMCGGVMFAQPRGQTLRDGVRYGYDTAAYDDREVSRIMRAGFELARQRSGRIVSADKANVMESYKLWRQVADEVAGEFPDMALTHMYADNCAYQMARDPAAFDVIVGCNLIGDFLSDLAAVVSGSLGMLPSACLCDVPVVGARIKGIYEPVHGSAPDIAGQGIANPFGMILSVAMMFRYTVGRPDLQSQIEQAVERVLSAGIGTPDIGGTHATQDVADAVIRELAP
ncbi:3-isopropylmalate dehydrogenase [Aliisedimentitalea scapharcae]|uniref:3-isopropylmalate dehydrogenase n=1 Tax=Aliisedimentitalea scapharcae TaxID=1524259 RepID=A0ABZ2XV61_9RHOB